jgi:cell wall-associated NlpC family hydrolase
MATSIQTPVGRAPVIPVVLIGVGFYLCWFAVHYWDSDTKWPSDPVKAVLTGKPLPAPSGQTSAADIAGQVAGNSPGQVAGVGAGGSSAATGSAISDAALRYRGQGYVWGGPADRPGNWDCSTFVSYVLGHDLGIKLPGGGKYGDQGYPPHSHGPTTISYLLYGTPVNFGQEQAGDLLVSTVHMGVCIGGGQMISAQDPQLGTNVSGYRTGFPGGTPAVRRISALPTGTVQAPGTTTAGGRGA